MVAPSSFADFSLYAVPIRDARPVHYNTLTDATTNCRRGTKVRTGAVLSDDAASAAAATVRFEILAIRRPRAIARAKFIISWI